MSFHSIFLSLVLNLDLEIKDTTDTDRSASYLDLHLGIDSEGQLRTNLEDKRDYLNFHIVNYPLICSNISVAPAYGLYISQLIRYPIACGSYHDFLDRGLLLTWTLPNQGFLLLNLKSSFRKLSVATMIWLTVTEYLFHK